MPAKSGRIAAKIRELAVKQYGHVTRQQLLGIGLSSRAIGRMIEAGDLIRVHAGVYAVGYVRRDPLAKAKAAVLACGPRAVLSHGSAAALWGIRRRWPSQPEVTVASDRRREGVRIHRTISLESQDIRTHKGIRVTSPIRTLRDIGPRLTQRERTRALNDARLMKLVRPEEVGNPAQNPTRSVFEDEFLAFAKRFGLPTPVVNATVNGREVDALFPNERVIVECDGYDFHSDRHSFESDRKNDVIALTAGYVTVRITWHQLLHKPAALAAQLKRILRQRASYSFLP